MTVKFSNQGSSALAAGITSSAITINLVAGEGAKFPALTGSDYFMLTLVKLIGGAPVMEIVKVTARAGDTLTVVRGQEGTAATTFSAGDRAENRLTAGALDRLVTPIDKTVTNATANGAVTLDCSTANIFELTLTGAATLSLSNLPGLTNETFAILVRVTQGATPYALTWFSGITWLTPGSLAPSAPAANKTIEYILTTKNGTAWLGRKGAYN